MPVQLNHYPFNSFLTMWRPGGTRPMTSSWWPWSIIWPLTTSLQTRPSSFENMSWTTMTGRSFQILFGYWRCAISLLLCCSELNFEQIYKEATLFFPHDSAATIAHVIPSMDWIDTVLCDAGTTALTPSVKHTLMFACKLLNKYYSTTDLSNVYRVAMGRLSFSLHYFVLLTRVL